MIELGDPLFALKEERASQTRFSREHKNVILEEEENHDRTGDPLFALNEERINSSLKTTKQNQICR